MLKELGVKNLTRFPLEHQLQFAAGLNVFMGENGTKTFLMKAIYSLIATSKEESCKQSPPPTKTYLQKAYANKSLGVFKPDTLVSLVATKCNMDEKQINRAVLEMSKITVVLHVEQESVQRYVGPADLKNEA